MAIVTKTKVILPKTISMLVYGASDAGKTVLASCSPELDPKETIIVEDALYIDVEGGAVSQITRGEGIIVPRWPEDPLQVCNTQASLAQVLTKVQNNPPKYVSLDSIDRFQEYIIEAAAEKNDNKKPRIQDWGDILFMFQKLGRYLPKWGTNIIMTCHMEHARDDNDRLTKRMPMMQGKFQNKLASYFDIVAYLEKTSDSKGNEMRRIHFKGTGEFFARTRLGCLPDHIDNPTIPGIINTYLDRRAKLIKSLEKNPNIQIVSN